MLRPSSTGRIQCTVYKQLQVQLLQALLWIVVASFEIQAIFQQMVPVRNNKKLRRLPYGPFASEDVPCQALRRAM